VPTVAWDSYLVRLAGWSGADIRADICLRVTRISALHGSMPQRGALVAMTRRTNCHSSHSRGACSCQGSALAGEWPDSSQTDQPALVRFSRVGTTRLVLTNGSPDS
jgi:hypothetical protein